MTAPVVDEPTRRSLGGPVVSAAIVLGIAVAIQVVLMQRVSIGTLHAIPDVMVVAVVIVGIHRGATVGAVGGFAAGILVELMLPGDTLGVVAMACVVIGAWCGRFAGGDPPPWWLVVVIGTAATGLVPLWVGIVQRLRGTGLPFGDLIGQICLPQMAFAPIITIITLWVAPRLLGQRVIVEPGMMRG